MASPNSRLLSNAYASALLRRAFYSAPNPEPSKVGLDEDPSWTHVGVKSQSMNLRQARKLLYSFVTLDPHPMRIDWEGRVWPPIEYLWQVVGVTRRRIHIRNISTDHQLELDARLFKQYDVPRPDAPHNVRGHLKLRSRIVLSGCNVFRSLSDYVEALRTRPQILMPVTYWH